VAGRGTCRGRLLVGGWGLRQRDPSS
jgi:hypothetical protein